MISMAYLRKSMAAARLCHHYVGNHPTRYAVAFGAALHSEQRFHSEQHGALAGLPRSHSRDGRHHGVLVLGIEPIERAAVHVTGPLWRRLKPVLAFESKRQNAGPSDLAG